VGRTLKRGGWGHVTQIKFSSLCLQLSNTAVADPGGVQTPAFLFRCPFLKRTYFENMSLQFLAEQGAS